MRPVLLAVRKLDADGVVVPGMAGARCGPVALDHGEHLMVAGQHIHLHRRHASRLGAGDQGAHQRRSQALALPGVGYHHADIGHLGVTGAAPVRCHGVPDDDGAPGGDHGVGGAGAAAAARAVVAAEESWSIRADRPAPTYRRWSCQARASGSATPALWARVVNRVRTQSRYAWRGLGTGHHECAPVERGIGELLALGVEDAEQPFAGARKRLSARLVRSLVPAGRPSR